MFVYRKINIYKLITLITLFLVPVNLYAPGMQSGNNTPTTIPEDHWTNSKDDNKEKDTCNGSPYKGDDLYEIKDWNNCIGTFIFDYDDPGKYVGEFKNGKAYGFGTLTWTNGNKYEGEWKDYKRHGQGTETWADGDKYEGDWKDDMRHGQGTLYYKVGDKYEGEYEDGLKHGQGTFYFKDGNKYEGEFEYDKIKEGIFYNENGDIIKKSPIRSVLKIR